MSKNITIVNNGKVYKSPDDNARVIADANIDDTFFYNRPLKRNKELWYEVQISRYQKGYIKQRKCYVWEKILIISRNSYCIPIGKDYATKVNIPFLSLIYQTRTRRRTDSSYRVQTKKGVIGIMPADTTKTLDVFWSIIVTVNFIVGACYAVAILLVSIMAGFFIAPLAQLSLMLILVVTNVVLLVLYILFFIIKLIIFEIRMRL